VTLVREIREGITRYAKLVDQTSRTSQRAQVLHLMDKLDLAPGRVVTRRVDGAELRADGLLRGAAVIHLDLVFRTSLSIEEILLTTDQGVVILATHPDAEDLPIGVIVAQPTTKLVRKRRELFRDVPRLDEAGTLMPFALAASPGRLGAGAALLRAIMLVCGQVASRPRVVTFSPLTGMRARVIRLVDQGWETVRRLQAATNPGVDFELLHAQLIELLSADLLPENMPEPARSWLIGETGRFAASSEYQVGNFHRAMGASFVGLVNCADPRDSDALWSRAYFDHGRPEAA
jgi:hypothetical protein